MRDGNKNLKHGFRSGNWDDTGAKSYLVNIKAQPFDFIQKRKKSE